MLLLSCLIFTRTSLLVRWVLYGALKRNFVLCCQSIYLLFQCSCDVSYVNTCYCFGWRQLESVVKNGISPIFVLYERVLVPRKFGWCSFNGLSDMCFKPSRWRGYTHFIKITVLYFNLWFWYTLFIVLQLTVLCSCGNYPISCIYKSNLLRVSRNTCTKMTCFIKISQLRHGRRTDI